MPRLLGNRLTPHKHDIMTSSGHDWRADDELFVPVGDALKVFRKLKQNNTGERLIEQQINKMLPHCYQRRSIFILLSAKLHLHPLLFIETLPIDRLSSHARCPLIVHPKIRALSSHATHPKTTKTLQFPNISFIMDMRTMEERLSNHIVATLHPSLKRLLRPHLKGISVAFIAQ